MSGFRILLTAIGVFALMAGASCSRVMPGAQRELPLRISSAIPGAEGKVRYEPQDNGQTDLEIRIQHLAPPEVAMEGATAYVAWMRPAQKPGQTIKLGVLLVDDDREARLKTSSAYRDFDVFVTAEPSGEVTTPSGDQIMTASIGTTMM